MLTVRIAQSRGFGVAPFKGLGRGDTLESAALSAYKDAGFRSGVLAHIVNDAENGRYGVQFDIRPRPRAWQTYRSATWDLQVVKK